MSGSLAVSTKARARVASSPPKWPWTSWRAGCITSSTAPSGHCAAAQARIASPRAGSRRELALTTPIRNGLVCMDGVASVASRASQAAGHSPVSSSEIKPMNKDYFFCGVGGSGMMPLAMIVQAQRNRISGSDRALDQGRTPEKFDWLRAHGVALHPQDGSGVVSSDQVVVATGAVEDTVPDIGAARRVGAVIKTRPQLLSELFNAAPTSVGVAGTSGKSTITGMVAWILDQAGRAPTVVNGAVMKNFATPDQPVASALVGGPDLFVAEVDESDGSIARYDPTVAVVSNISLDHKSMEELRDLFGGFVGRAATAVLNLDNPETAALAQTLAPGKAITFALGEEEADLSAHGLQPLPTGMTFELRVRGEAARSVTLTVPGAHNVANALAALGAVRALGVGLDQAVAA